MDKRVYGDDVRVLPDITSEEKENEHGTQRKNEPGILKVNFISLKETAQASRKIEIMVGSLPIRRSGKSTSDSCSSAAEEATSRSRSSSNSSAQWRIGDERKKRIGDEIHLEDSTEKAKLHDTGNSSHSECADFSKHQHEEAPSDQSAAERQLLAAEAHQDDKDNDNDSEDSFSEESDLVRFQLRLRKFLQNSRNFDLKKTHFLKHVIKLMIDHPCSPI
jgi:hypothetical protein